MSIIIKIFSHRKHNGSRFYARGGDFEIHCDRISQDLGINWLGRDRTEHVLHVTTAHPLISEDRLHWVKHSAEPYHYWPFQFACTDELEGDPLTELAVRTPVKDEAYGKQVTDGIGIGALVYQDRVPEFKDLDTLFEAFWDYYGMGTKSLDAKRNALISDERTFGVTPYRLERIEKQKSDIEADRVRLAEWKEKAQDICKMQDKELYEECLARHGGK
ncbi:hypothetical protein F4779DRAFT_559355 [Xylariaceae sp. FL0662B]|nr:hypothetical protein F4779DRAFT_559355 [Xylariaceae sp. FL0662B]